MTGRGPPPGTLNNSLDDLVIFGTAISPHLNGARSSIGEEGGVQRSCTEFRSQAMTHKPLFSFSPLLPTQTIIDLELGTATAGGTGGKEDEIAFYELSLALLPPKSCEQQPPPVCLVLLPCLGHKLPMRL